ncbi:MAG: glycosyltransferase [Campylobacterota bacterium]|nr:glycosyltransferase [Campylobacterota bacterium]
MNKIHIAIKNKTQLTQALESKYEVDYHKEQTFFEKLTLKDKIYPDIYFHQGVVNEYALSLVENSSKIIVNSQYIKDEIIKKKPYITQRKIDIIYPYINSKIKYDKQTRKDFRKEHSIAKNTRLIYFTGKDLKQSGIDKFFKIIEGLDRNNFKVIIDTDSKQLESVRIKIDKTKMIDTFILLENYEDKEQLFIVSDIFILPTKQKLFVPNILKAMYFKCAVFVMKSNASSELVDSFSLIRGVDDPSTSFKVDALLLSNDELKKIKKENNKIAKTHTLQNNLKEIEQIIENIFDN